MSPNQLIEIGLHTEVMLFNPFLTSSQEILLKQILLRSVNLDTKERTVNFDTKERKLYLMS